MKCIQRIISVLLVMAMVFGMMPPMAVSAEETEPVTEQTTAADGETTVPSEPVTEPTEETTAPMEAEPIEETAVPTEPVTDPDEETTAPTEPVTEPTEETTVPTETETEPPTESGTSLETVVADVSMATADDSVIADNICGDNLTWTVEDGTLTISGTGPMYNFDGWGAAPWAELEISEVVISEGVTTIGDYAFNSCYYMDVDEIILPDGLESIGEYAFAWTWIADISLPDSIIKIEKGAFQGLGITSIVLPVGIKTIEAYMFDSCTMLQSIVIPEGVTSIEEDAFYDCMSLTDIDFPDSLISIGEDAFWSMGGTLDKFTIPKNIEYIGSRALGSPSCVIFEGRAPVFHETAFEYDTVIVYYPEDDTTWTADVMQDYGNSTITWVPYNGTLPMSGSLSEIANWEFDEQTETLTISGTGVIGGHDYVYSEDDFTVPWIHLIDQIKTVVVEEGISEIGQDLFYEHTSLETAKLPTTLHIICDRAFLGCISLNSVELPNNLATIGYGAFKGCTALENINIPDSVTNIGASAFEWCVSLKNIVLPEGLTRINAETFYGCYDLVTIEIPDSVTGIDYGVFCECTSLKELILPANLTGIGSEAFFWCENLESITIPAKVTSIGSFAFEGCENLTEIHFLGDAPKISSGAFDYVTATVYYPENNTTWTEEVMQDYGGTLTWPHMHTYIPTITTPTCKEDGYTTYTCKCGDSYVGDYVDAVGHDYHNGVCSHCNEIDPDVSIIDCGVCGDDLTWVLDGEGTLTITGTGSMPDYDNSSPWCNYQNQIKMVDIRAGVTNIGDCAFQGHSNLVNVTIPEGVISLGYYAFRGCSNLTDITIPEGVTYIGYNVFEDCSSLTTVVLPNSLSYIEYGMFRGCTSLIDVTMSTSITDISAYAFEGCSSLTSMVIPEGVDSIGGSAFEGCSSLSNIKIPDGVTRIGGSVFRGCSSLTSVIIPGSVTCIVNNAFSGCNNLMDVYYSESLLEWNALEIGDGNNALLNANIHFEIEHIHNYSSVVTSPTCEENGYTTYTCECGDTYTDDSVEATGHIMGEWCIVTEAKCEIEGEERRECKKCDYYETREIKAFGHVLGEWYGYKAATCQIEGEERRDCGNCDHYEIGILPKLDHNYQNGICTRCGEINPDAGFVANGVCGENVTWVLDSEGTLTISGTGKMLNYGVSAPWYANIEQIKLLDIQNGVTSIGERAFSGCRNLTSVTIPEGVTSIGSYAFCGCSSLTKVTIPEGVTSIGGYAFEGCSSLTKVTIPKGVIRIGYYAFSKCKDLASLTIPKGVTSIEANVFERCSSLTSVTIPEGVTSIGDCAFDGCSSLTSVTIPESVTSIGSGAFYKCRSLANVTIPEGVTSIGAYAFYGCSNLTNVTILKGVTSIGAYAFYGCSNLTSVTIPKGVTSIGAYAFYGCSSLRGVTIPDSITTIGEYAFCGCSSLTNVTIPEGVTSIEKGAFAGCSSLTGVTIQESVTSIGGYAFYGCSSLENVYFTGSKAEWNTIFIGDGNDYLVDATIHYNSTGPNDENGPDEENEENGIVRFFRKWDAETQTAYWGEEPPSVEGLDLGSQITEETDTSFLENVNSLVGTYVLAATKKRDDGMIAADILLSITPLENKMGTITRIDKETLSIDGIDYPVSGDLLLSLFSVGDQVTYYLHDGEIVEIKAIKTPEMVMLKQVSVICYANQKPADEPKENYVLSSKVEATVGSDIYHSDSQGQITITGEPEDQVTFSQDGYVSRTFTLEELSDNNQIYLQQKSDAPVIYGLWMEGTNILQKEMTIPYATDDSFDLLPEIEWGESNMRRLTLSQEENILYLEDGVNAVQIAKYFDIGKNIILSATNENGKTATKILKIKSDLNSAFDGFSFDWGDKVEITLPESAGILAGTKLSADLYSRVPVEVVIEDGKFYASLGYQIDGKIDDKSGEFKGEIKNAVKEAQKMLNLAEAIKTNNGDMKQLWSELKNLSRKWVPVEGSLAVKGGASFVGFAEGYVNEEGLVFTKSGGVLLFTGGVSYIQPFALPFAPTVPLFFELSLDGETEAMFNLFIDNKLKEFTPKIKIENKVELGAGVGVGLPRVLSISGGGKGKLTTSMHFDRKVLEYSKIVGSLDVYVKLKLVLATFEKSWNLKESTWYEDPSPVSAVMALGLDDELEAQSGGRSEFFDASRYTIDDLSYLSTGSTFMGSTSSFSRRSLNNAPFVSNAYEGADPQTASFSDGTRLAVWIGYNNNHSGANALNLYYSYYNGSWSQPEIVEADGTTDAYPDLKIINDTAYLVWQDASGSIGNNATLDSIANLMEISGAVFDKETERFVCSSITSGSDVLNMQPKLCGDNSAVYVVWHRNNENDWFGQNSSNSLLCSRFSGNSWGGSSVLYSGLNPLMGFDVSCSGGSCIVAYAMDNDGDLNTTEDLEVYKNGAALTENDWLDSGVTFCGTDLYWYSGGTLLRNGNDTMPEGVFIGSDRFQIVNEHGVHAVVYAEEDGLASVLKVAYYDASSGGWGRPIDLYNAGTSISAFSASATVDGEISVLIQSQDVVGEFDGTDPYGTVNLVWYNAPMGCDIRLDEVRYYNENYILGNDMPVYLTVTNTGELAVQKLQVDLLDEEGNVVLSKTIEQTLLSGATKEIEFLYHVTSVESGKKLTVRVYPVDMDDIFLEDNIGEMMLGWDDIAVEDIHAGLTETGKIVIHANIVNRGYQPQNNVTVRLLEMSPSGTIVETIMLESIDAQSRASVSFTLGNLVSKVYYVVIDHKETDQNYSNDNDFVNISADIDSESVYGENAVLIHETELGKNSILCIDGAEQKLKKFDEYYYLNLYNGNGTIMTAYSYHIDDYDDIHTQYPVSMKVWTLENNDGFYTATRQEEFDDILQYVGSSIRVTGKKGIRMITAIDQADKKALTGEGLAGYTLKEYGTVIAWASQISEDEPLVLGKSYVRSNYAYKKGVADPIFAYKEDKMQYTNVLVNFSDVQCSKDIAMRPYMILTDGENDITLYGGIVERSIGYIALQNKDTFTKGTEAYNYVWGIIKSVYGDVEE